jgi:hypothetical protein
MADHEPTESPFVAEARAELMKLVETEEPDDTASESYVSGDRLLEQFLEVEEAD